MANKDVPIPALLSRLQSFAKSQHLTIYQLNKEAGLCKGLISNAISKRQGLTTPTLIGILSAFPQINANWLLMGRGEMLLNLDEEAQKNLKFLYPQEENTSNTATNDVVPSRATLESIMKQRNLDLEALQQQCIALVRTIQQMRHKEQNYLDAQFIDTLHVL